MKSEEPWFEQAKAAFNSIKIFKGQIATMATCDSLGHPNVAPIGSMHVVDSNTVHVLQGLLPRSMKNLKTNPRAAFSVNLPMTLGSVFAMLRSGDDAPSGYRIYCELERIEDDASVVKTAAQALANRVPFFFRRPFARFCDKTLKRLLIFKILEIRPT
jgi:hypothetical protein